MSEQPPLTIHWKERTSRGQIARLALRQTTAPMATGLRQCITLFQSRDCLPVAGDSIDFC
jgi:hypothetical protein